MLITNYYIFQNICGIVKLQNCGTMIIWHIPTFFRIYYCRTAESQKLDDNNLLLSFSNHLRNCRIAELWNHDYLKYTNFFRIYYCRTAELQNCRIAELQNCGTAELQKLDDNNLLLYFSNHLRIVELQNCGTMSIWCIPPYIFDLFCGIVELRNCRIAETDNDFDFIFAEW